MEYENFVRANWEELQSLSLEDASKKIWNWAIESAKQEVKTAQERVTHGTGDYYLLDAVLKDIDRLEEF